MISSVLAMLQPKGLFFEAKRLEEGTCHDLLQP
jgi:hypothetical protein